MTDFLPPVIAVLLLETGKFSAGIGKATSEMSAMETATGKLAKVGKAAFLGLSVAAVAIGAESVKMAANFDQAMEMIHTQAGASQAEVEALKSSVLGLAPSVGIGPEPLAEGLYHVESAGFRGKEAMDILAASAKDAAIGQSDLESTTQALIGTMAVGFKDVQNAADAGAYLNTIVGIGDMRMQKLAASIATGVLPSFKAFGLGMKDFGAGLATLTDNVTPADEAATRLRMAVTLLGAPSGAGAKALRAIGLGANDANKAFAHRAELAKYGISLSQLSADLRQPNGLLTAVMDLKGHLEAAGLSAVEQSAVVARAFGGAKTAAGILTMMEETDRLKSKYAALGTASTRAAGMQESWASQQKQFSQQLHQLGAEAQVVGIKIGNFLIPYIQASASWLAKHIEVVKIAAVAIGGILVAAMMAWTASVIANTVAMLADPMTWILIGIVAVVALVAVGIYELVKHWSTVWAWIKRISLDVWHALVVAWQATWNAIKAVGLWVYREIIQPIVRFFNDFLVKPAKMYLDVLTAAWKFAWGFFSVVVDDFVKIWTGEWRLIQTVAELVWNNGLKQLFHWIYILGIKPIQDAIHILGLAWDYEWANIKRAASLAWDGLKLIWAAFVKVGIDPIRDGIHAFAQTWDLVWNGAKRTVLAVWDVLRPVFHAIGDAVSSVIGALGSIGHAPGAAGQAFAHMLGFDEGGPVPGAPGAPMLAVVHGGEFVLSRDMISSLRRSATLGGGGTTPLPALAASMGAQTIVVQNHNHLYLDGKQIVGGLTPAVRQFKGRNGFSPFEGPGR